MKILYIEDNEYVSESLPRALKELIPTLEVKVLKGADDVFDFQGDKEVDIILLDIMMYYGDRLTGKETEDGYLTGLSLIPHIISVQGNTPIIILTALQEPYFKTLRDNASEYKQVKEIWMNPKPVKDIAKGIMKYFI
ncbi:MAG: hypothetical protein JXD22_02605 [Sedimentisphaerales bacterium]|nr:hypothetical protein [Sedimentisphaerales bacterium]